MCHVPGSGNDNGTYPGEIRGLSRCAGINPLTVAGMAGENTMTVFRLLGVLSGAGGGLDADTVETDALDG